MGRNSVVDNSEERTAAARAVSALRRRHARFDGVRLPSAGCEPDTGQQGNVSGGEVCAFFEEAQHGVVGGPTAPAQQGHRLCRGTASGAPGTAAPVGDVEDLS